MSKKPPITLEDYYAKETSLDREKRLVQAIISKRMRWGKTGTKKRRGW